MQRYICRHEEEMFMVHYVKTNHLTKQYVEFELIFIFIKYIERREGRGEG